MLNCQRQLSELLYRDDLVLKHSASTHIRSTVKQIEDAAASVSKKSAKEPSSAGATLVAALIDFLIQARLGTCDHFSLRFTDIFDLLLVKRLLIVQVQVPVFFTYCRRWCVLVLAYMAGLQQRHQSLHLFR